MHSTMTPAVRLSIARSIARRSLYGTCLKPGTRGSKPCWYFSWPVAAKAAKVRPWNELRVATNSTRSDAIRSRAYLRATLSAASLASAPEFEKNMQSANECYRSEERAVGKESRRGGAREA